MDEQSGCEGKSWIDFVINKTLAAVVIFFALPVVAILATSIAVIVAGVAIVGVVALAGFAIVVAIVKVVTESEWYRDNGKLALMLLLFFPLGIYGCIKRLKP